MKCPETAVAEDKECKIMGAQCICCGFLAGPLWPNV